MTQAQQVHDEFLTSAVTVSIKALAAKHHAEKERVAGLTVWRFLDGSHLVINGTGRAHRMTVLPPEMGLTVIRHDILTSEKKAQLRNRESNQ